MALIKSQLVLTDGMTAPLRSINKAMNLVLNSFESMQSASGKSIDVKAFQNAREELARMGTELDDVDRKAKQVNTTGGAMQSTFMRLAAAVGSAFAISKVIGLADSMTQTSARLNLITGDLEKTAALQDQIMESANRSRASYSDTANMVAKLGVNARDAFTNTDELVAFSELVNKTFTISGASAEEQKNATLQLTQAMASGVLRGDELRAIFEQSPVLIQTIADYLEKPIGSIRQMAADGQITADIVKNAMLSSADSINAQFEAIPYTFAQIWTMMQNILLEAFGPLIQAIGSAAQWIYDNWSTIEPVLVGVAAGAIALAVGLGILALTAKIANGSLQTLFLRLLTNPLTYIVIGIGLVVALIYKWIQSVGGLSNAWNICKAGLLVGMTEVKLGFFTGIYFVLDLVDKLTLGWQKAGIAIANFMGDMKVNVLTILQNLINGAINIINGFINVLNKIPGVSIGLVEQVTFATTAAAENEAVKQARAEDLAAYESEIAAGQVERQVNLDAIHSELGNAQSAFTSALESGKAEALAKDNSTENLLYETNADTDSIADSAGSAADSLKDTTEDLKYLRDIAEQEAINRFTTAEVKIDMTGMTNRIDSDMDLDGVITTLTAGFAEALEVAAEGVHA